MAGIQEERGTFNEAIAPRLAQDVGVATPWDGRGSTRFAYFANDTRFVVIAGDQEGDDTDLALAYGLTYRAGLNLTVVLPEKRAFSTMQRVPWFAANVGIEVWLHDGRSAREARILSKNDTVRALSTRLKTGQDLSEELRVAATPKYLGHRSSDVFELVEWATKHPLLDPGHRKGERSWHCMGQKVLSVKGTAGGLKVRGGIHFSADPPPAVFVKAGIALVGRELEDVKTAVESAIDVRLHGGFAKPDEHWLQALIRRDPALVGVEQPTLRELPAWRPRPAAAEPGTASQWGRGYIDLLGVDGHGDLRLIETKLAGNDDELLVMQGLDYYVWARAYDDVLRTRLGAPTASATELHYVVGDDAKGKVRVSGFTAAQALGLDPEICWRFQTVRNWFHTDGDTRQIRSELLPPGVVPESE